MTTRDYADAAADLTAALKLATAPIGITFGDDAPPDAPRFDGDVPEPTADGRTGKVPAGCVFWMHAAKRTFTTKGEDHGNCSVGSVTHGFKTLEDAATAADVGALVEAGWVSPDAFPHLPVVKRRYAHVTYGPLADAPVDPDVVLLRVNGRQAMQLHAAVDDLKVEGKPQCHIIAMAKEGNDVALSVGCALSRVRTEMSNHEMTCAVPVARLGEVIEGLKTTAAADHAVSRYAAEDARRFRA